MLMFQIETNKEKNFFVKNLFAIKNDIFIDYTIFHLVLSSSIVLNLNIKQVENLFQEMSDAYLKNIIMFECATK